MKGVLVDCLPAVLPELLRRILAGVEGGRWSGGVLVCPPDAPPVIDGGGCPGVRVSDTWRESGCGVWGRRGKESFSYLKSRCEFPDRQTTGAPGG